MPTFDSRRRRHYCVGVERSTRASSEGLCQAKPDFFYFLYYNF